MATLPPKMKLKEQPIVAVNDNVIVKIDNAPPATWAPDTLKRFLREMQNSSGRSGSNGHWIVQTNRQQNPLFNKKWSPGTIQPTKQKRHRKILSFSKV